MCVCVCVCRIYFPARRINSFRSIDRRGGSRERLRNKNEGIDKGGKLQKKKKKKKKKAKISGFSGGFQCVKSVCKRVYMYKISGREAES